MTSMVYIKSYNTPKINKKEALRYAGVSEADEEILALLDRCIDESADTLSYKVCYSRFTIKTDGDSLDLGFAKTSSHSLGICLRECDEIVVFCATVGVELDRLIKKFF